MLNFPLFPRWWRRPDAAPTHSTLSLSRLYCFARKSAQPSEATRGSTSCTRTLERCSRSQGSNHRFLEPFLLMCMHAAVSSAHLSRRKCDLVLARPSICSSSSRVISQALYITNTPGRTITSHLSLNTFPSLIFFKGCANCESDGEIRGDCSFLLYILRGETVRKRLISQTPSESRCFHLICFPSEACSVAGALGQVWILSPLGGKLLRGKLSIPYRLVKINKPQMFHTDNVLKNAGTLSRWCPPPSPTLWLSLIVEADTLSNRLLWRGLIPPVSPPPVL